MSTHNLQIRDPLHGVIFISDAERHIIDSKIFGRLRNIKQVGFADFAFPGATHTRYSHSLGAMHIAGRIFDRVFAKSSLSTLEHQRFNTLVRSAALLHDLGHPPLSHTTEIIMPTRQELFGQNYKKSLGQATHEDFTLMLINSSELRDIININFKSAGVCATQISKLLEKDFSGDYFRVNNIDYGPVLSQIISSEIDADRMDYLLRDSFFCGVSYGKFDLNWLIENLISVVDQNSAYLGLRARAIFAFEDFLLSRYHMFVSVYLHHTPVILEKMLECFFNECAGEFSLACDPQSYSNLDDLDLWQALRKSANPWAERIVNRKPYVLLVEQCESYQASSLPALCLKELALALEKAAIHTIVARSKSVLSHYRGTRKLWVETSANNFVALEEYAQIFSRYEKPAEFARIFVDKKDFSRAQHILSKY